MYIMLCGVAYVSSIYARLGDLYSAACYCRRNNLVGKPMILYIKCVCGANKLLAQKFAREGYEIRAINMNPIWRVAYKAYEMKLPFIVGDDGQAKAIV